MFNILLFLFQLLYSPIFCQSLLTYTKSGCISFHLFGLNRPDEISSRSDQDGLRINKCIPFLSRREADRAIEEFRVLLNEKVAVSGSKVKPGDIIKLDGKKINWKESAERKSESGIKALVNTEATEIYLKYWKPVGVTCTTNLADSSNIIHAGKFHLFPQRVFPVGRLDKDSSGLIILTSDGSIVNYLLDPKKRRAKEYIVTFRRRPTDDEIKLLSTGVVITTLSQRENSKPVTAKTLPCQVRRDPSSERYVLGVYSRFIISYIFFPLVGPWFPVISY